MSKEILEKLAIEINIRYMDRYPSKLDSEKMSVPDYPQLYTSVGSKNLVIDALPFTKFRTIVPITMNLPVSKFYQLQLDELNLKNASLTLEDKQENVFQDLSILPCYSFYSINGKRPLRFTY